jgi:DNA-directed RNA polymerase specialized sigma24 family protein
MALRFAGKMASRVPAGCLSRTSQEEYLSECWEAILSALDSWQPGQGASVSTYVFNALRFKLLRPSKSRGRLIHIPEHVHQSRGEHQAKDPTSVTGGGDRNVYPVVSVSLSEPASDGQEGESQELYRAWARAAVEDRVHDQVALSQVLDRLPPQEASALLLWARGYTEREIGQMIGVGRGGAHYLREMALKRARRVANAAPSDFAAKPIPSPGASEVSVAAKKDSAPMSAALESEPPPPPQWVVYFTEAGEAGPAETMCELVRRRFPAGLLPN